MVKLWTICYGLTRILVRGLTDRFQTVVLESGNQTENYTIYESNDFYYTLVTFTSTNLNLGQMTKRGKGIFSMMISICQMSVLFLDSI